jgi:hypothetical protein
LKCDRIIKAQDPEFRPQYHQKREKKEEEVEGVKERRRRRIVGSCFSL